jgi:hypothetical protein
MLDPFIREAGGLATRRIEGKPEPWMNYLAIFLWTPFVAIAAFGVFEGLLAFTTAEHDSYSAWGTVAVVVGVLVLGFVASVVREGVRSRHYPLGEIGVGLAAAAVGVHSTADSLARVIVIFTSVRIIADGMIRFRQFHKSKSV